MRVPTFEETLKEYEATRDIPTFADTLAEEQANTPPQEPVREDIRPPQMGLVQSMAMGLEAGLGIPVSTGGATFIPGQIAEALDVTEVPVAHWMYRVYKPDISIPENRFLAGMAALPPVDIARRQFQAAKGLVTGAPGPPKKWYTFHDFTKDVVGWTGAKGFALSTLMSMTMDAVDIAAPVVGGLKAVKALKAGTQAADFLGETAQAAKKVVNIGGFITTKAGNDAFIEIAKETVERAAKRGVDITKQDNISNLAKQAVGRWRKQYPNLPSAQNPEALQKILHREALQEQKLPVPTAKQLQAQEVMRARQRVMQQFNDGSLELSEESADVASKLKRGGVPISEVKGVPPGVDITKPQLKKLQNELNAHTKRLLGASNLDEAGRPTAFKSSFEGNMVVRKGNHFTVVDTVAERDIAKNLERERSIVQAEQEARELATTTFTVPEEHMLDIQNLTSGYKRQPEATRIMVEDAVKSLYPEYDDLKIKAIATTGTPQAPIPQKMLNKKFADAFGQRGLDTPKIIATKYDHLFSIIKQPGKAARDISGLLERGITHGMDASLRRMGGSGTELADRMETTLLGGRGRAGLWSSRYKNAVQRSHLTKGQMDDAVSLIEGHDEAGNIFTFQQAQIKYGDAVANRMRRYAADHKAIMDDIHATANQVFLEAGGTELPYIENYWAHLWDWEKLSDMMGGVQETQRRIVESIAERRGITVSEATIEFNKYYRSNRQFFAPSLTEARIADMGDYRRTPDSQLDYINSAAQKIEETKQLGLNYSRANELIELITQETGDISRGNFAQAIFDRKFKREPFKLDELTSRSYLEKLKNIALVRLAFSSISNSTQSLLTGFRTSFLDTATVLRKMTFSQEFRKQMVDLAEESGALSIGGGELGKVVGPVVGAVERVSGKRANLLRALFDRSMQDFWASELGVSSDNPILRATGFNATERFNRIVAANAGKTYLDTLVQRIARGKNVKRNTRELEGLLKSADDDLTTPLINYAKRHKNVNLDAIAKNTTHQLSEVAGKAQLRAALRVAEDSQFGITGRFKLPFFWNSDWGKLLTQYKSFSFRTTQLLWREFQRHPKKMLRSAIPYVMMAYPTHFGISRLQEIIHGGEYKQDAWELVEPLFAAGIGSVFYNVLRSAGSKRGTISEAFIPPSVSVITRPVGTTAGAAFGVTSPEYAIEEAIRALGAIPGPQQAGLAVAGPVVAGAMRRERRGKRKKGTFGKFR
jgi:hypothetical protein